MQKPRNYVGNNRISLHTALLTPPAVVLNAAVAPVVVPFVVVVESAQGSAVAVVCTVRICTVASVQLFVF